MMYSFGRDHASAALPRWAMVWHRDYLVARHEAVTIAGYDTQVTPSKYWIFARAARLAGFFFGSFWQGRDIAISVFQTRLHRGFFSRYST